MSPYRLSPVTVMAMAAVFCPGCTGIQSSVKLLEPLVENCEWARFRAYPYEHLVNDIPNPFVVGSIAGKIVNSGGWWQVWASIDVQIYPMTKRDAGVSHLEVSPQGDFSASGLDPGLYCLKVSSDGWQTATAAVIVDPDAKASDRIIIEMILGV